MLRAISGATVLKREIHGSSRSFYRSTWKKEAVSVKMWPEWRVDKSGTQVSAAAATALQRQQLWQGDRHWLKAYCIDLHISVTINSITEHL
jgi:hypothetical protein